MNNNHYQPIEEENNGQHKAQMSTQIQHKMECEESISTVPQQQQQRQLQKENLSQSQQFQAAPMNPSESLFSSNPRLNSDSFNHILAYFKDHQKLIDDLLRVVADKPFIESCLAHPPALETADYTKFSELLLKVINETVEFDQVRSHGDNKSNKINNNDTQSSNIKEPSSKQLLPSKGVSKKQISRNKLNRYIIILNRINEKRVLKSLHLKKYIILLEKHQGVGEIDKKTLEHILNTFQHIGYIHIIKKDIHIKTIKQNIVRAIIVHKDVPLSDPKVLRAERTIQNGLLKQGSKGNNENNGDEEFSDYSDDSFSRETPLKSSSAGNNSMNSGNNGNRKSKESTIITRRSMDNNKALNSQKSNSQQTDITNFFTKKKRINVSSRPEVYYYDEEEDGKDDDDSFVDGESNNGKKQAKKEAVKKEEFVETSGQINLQGASDGDKERQLREALAKVNKANCEVSAKPHKLQIFLALLIQILHSKNKLLKEEAFGKLQMKEDYSQIYSQICFSQPKELKYPVFQANLCKNLLALSASVIRPMQQQHWQLDFSEDMDIMHEEEQFSVEQLISSAFRAPILEEEEENAGLSLSSSASSPERVLEIANREYAQIEQTKMNLSEMRGKDFKNIPTAQQENIIKLKNYLLRNPSKTLAQLKIRFPIVHYFSFLSSCAYSGSMKFFILDANFPVIKHAVDLKDIHQDNLDQIYYQITPEYYAHFNLL